MNTILVLLFSLFLMACGKDVSKVSEQALQSTPTQTQPQVQQPIQSSINIAFANHAEIGSNDNLLTTYTFSDNVVLTTPIFSSGVSYQTMTHPYLTLSLNETVICYYSWNGSNYQKYGNCPSAVVVNKYDKIKFSGIPSGQTVWFLLEYQK